jgi:hypothetical protein
MRYRVWRQPWKVFELKSMETRRGRYECKKLKRLNTHIEDRKGLLRLASSVMLVPNGIYTGL